MPLFMVGFLNFVFDSKLSDLITLLQGLIGVFSITHKRKHAWAYHRAYILPCFNFATL